MTRIEEVINNYLEAKNESDALCCAGTMRDELEELGEAVRKFLAEPIGKNKESMALILGVDLQGVPSRAKK